jgi:predicted NAD/FAD-binding protein
LLAQWCVELDEFKGFSAYNALKYSTANRLVGLSLHRMKEIVGGTQVYIQSLAVRLTRTKIRLASTITNITRHHDIFTVEEADGTRHEFDHLIIATDAVSACQLLREVEGCTAFHSELARIEYFPTTIALHGDRRLMPTKEIYWSIFNICYDGQHSANTVWKRWLSPRRPIFKSWVTFAPQMPDPLYASVHFQHPKINLNYYEAQRNLNNLQGKNNLWLAGLYMHDIDCHESAILSAVKVARRLAPDSANLRKLG